MIITIKSASHVHGGDDAIVENGLIGGGGEALHCHKHLPAAILQMSQQQHQGLHCHKPLPAVYHPSMSPPRHRHHHHQHTSVVAAVDATAPATPSTHRAYHTAASATTPYVCTAFCHPQPKHSRIHILPPPLNLSTLQTSARLQSALQLNTQQP